MASRGEAALILLDTNILVRQAKIDDPDSGRVDVVLRSLGDAGHPLCIVPQNLYEFWAVATRPIPANGLGLSVRECREEVVRIKRIFQLLPDDPGLFAEWEVLVEAGGCQGRVSFDARLVAAMRTHGVTRLLTFNTSDFARFPGIFVLDPRGSASFTA